MDLDDELDYIRRAAKKEENKKKLYWGLGIFVAIFVIFLWPHTTTWDGDGTINAFPSTDSVKNYRLDATMTVWEKKYGWVHYHYAYTSIVGNWPDGGTLELDGCTVKDTERAYCTDQDGKEYGVEVVAAPDPPDTSDPGDSGSGL